MIDVVVRNVVDLEEVTISIADTATIRELKQALCDLAERPELMEVGEIMRMQPDGSTAQMKETIKIGIRRLFGFKGCPLYPPPPDRALLSLDDFLDFDADEEAVDSPRSVRACMLEGTAPEDLIFVPLEVYQQRGRVEPRIAELWYDFFEAVRQDSLEATKNTRAMLIAEEEGKFVPAALQPHETRIAGTGGHWCGALGQARNLRVQDFFQKRNQMCEIDRVYRGATKPYRPTNKGSRYFSSVEAFVDEDPVLAGDTADDAADKLADLLTYYNRLPNSKKFVEEQRLKTKATGVVQYNKGAQKLHRDQDEFQRLLKHRNEISEAQIALVDGNIQTRNETRRDQDARSLASKPPKTKLEVIRNVAIKKRADYFAEKRADIHEAALDREYWRVDEMQRITLHDQACEERVHQHRSKTQLAFAREWTKRRVRWQLNNNSITQNRNAFNQATMEKQQAASDRVDTQHLIRQKWIEYKREIRTLKRLFADMAANREKARQDARRDAVCNEFSRMSIEEAMPSTSPLRRSKSMGMSLGMSTASAFSMQASVQTAGSWDEMNATAPFSHLLKQPRVVKRIARFDFPRMGSGVLSSQASTRSSLHASMTMPSLSGTSQQAEQRELQKALAYN